MPKTTDKPLVALVGTGGTIASTGSGTLDLVEYAGPVLDAESLAARVPELRAFADVLCVPHDTVGSDEIGPRHWLALARALDSLAADRPELAGVVVSHGTATLEETAYFLNLTLRVPIPVVVTGAQRPITGLSSDGPINLVNAVRVAAAGAARGMGVLVLMNDEIHAAREVTKSSVFRLHAFQTPELGALGHADQDRVCLFRRPLRRHMPDTEFALAGLEALPRVDIVPSYAGADQTAIDAFVAAGASGLVVEALAPGLVPPDQVGALRRAAADGIIVAYSRRAPGGRVLALRKHQVSPSVTADNLTPQKARVLLMLALTRTAEPAAIQAMFDRY